MDCLDELSAEVKKRHGYEMVPQEAAEGIASEAGEYLQHVRKWNYEGVPFNQGEAMVELSDVLHYVLQACRDHGITIEQLARVNLMKLRARKKGEVRTFDREMRNLQYSGELDHTLDGIEALIEVVSR